MSMKRCITNAIHRLLVIIGIVDLIYFINLATTQVQINMIQNKNKVILECAKITQELVQEDEFNL